MCGDVQPVAPVQEIQLDNKGGGDHVGADGAQQFYGGGRCAAGGQQVVHQHHFLIPVQRVFLNFDRVGAVFELIGVRDGLARQLVFLAEHGESDSQPQGKRRGNQETTGFDTDQPLRFVGADFICQPVDGRRPGFRMLQQRRDVVKKNARLGKIRHRPYMVFEVHDVS